MFIGSGKRDRVEGHVKRDFQPLTRKEEEEKKLENSTFSLKSLLHLSSITLFLSPGHHCRSKHVIVSSSKTPHLIRFMFH